MTLEAAVFEGTGQNVFRDRKEFFGPLLQQLNEVYDYIDLHNQIYATFEKLRRIDKRDYPEVAIREALLNSLVHRDYSFGASTLISIYNDRIEFTSIGGLLTGVSLNDIMLGLSVCRNPKLANIFYRLELIEAYGTGIRKILKAYENSKMRPVIEATDNAFKITLPNINAVSPLKAEGTHENSKLEAEVLNFVKRNGIITRQDVEKIANVKQTAAGRLLNKMIRQNLLVPKGQGKNRQYTSPV